MGFFNTVHCGIFSALISSGQHVLHAIFCAFVFAFFSIGNRVICRNVFKNIV